LGRGITRGGCLESCELVSRVDGEDHALLTVAGLTTVYPDRVGVGHGELRLLEVGVVVGHGDADKSNQNSSRTREGKRYLQARVKATGSGTTRAFEGGLCRRVILLHEDEGDDIAGVGSLKINARLEAQDGKLCRQPTTLEGLYWVTPPGPPTVTWISADFTGRTAIKPSKAESVKSLENITSVS